MKNSIKAAKRLLKNEDRQLRNIKSSGKLTLPNGYRPYLEHSDEIIPELAFHYLQLIEILRRAVDIGRVCIFTEVVEMS